LALLEQQAHKVLVEVDLLDLLDLLDLPDLPDLPDLQELLQHQPLRFHLLLKLELSILLPLVSLSSQQVVPLQFLLSAQLHLE
jgi:hypothetical protein